jgi:hypothetical protein
VSALVFLLVALAVSAVGSSILWLRSRKPTSLQSSIDAFNREMRALRPEDESPARRRIGDRGTAGER